MTDFIATNDDRRWDADRAEFFVEAERCGWENRGDLWRVADSTGRATAQTQQTTATERWGRSVLIIAALSALSWAVVIGIVIAALAAL